MRYTKPSTTIQCPMCDKEIHSRGFFGHIRLFHPENLKESQEYWAEWKKTKKDWGAKKIEVKKEPESEVDQENEEVKEKLEKIDIEKILLKREPKKEIKAETKKEEKEEKEEEKKEEAKGFFDFSSLALIGIPLIVGGVIWYFSRRAEKEKPAESIEPKEKYRDFDIGGGKIIKIPIRK